MWKRKDAKNNGIEKDSLKNFPNIYSLNKKKNENYLNINLLFNDINNNIELNKLNQLHKNL